MKLISRLATIIFLTPTLIGCSQEKITKECQNIPDIGTIVTINQDGENFHGSIMLDDTTSYIVLLNNFQQLILERRGTISWKNNRNNSCEKSL
ncbi:MAG: hypothetical protein RJB24_470 [Candidatus Parcubacteria bacterium]|jgi:hypothetical protein